MQQTRAKYEQLIRDLRGDLRPQREWCEGRGLFLVFGHFVGGVAAGAWLFSLLFDSRAGLGVAFALGALCGISHLAFLGRPQRFWRMAAQWRTSWISRGFAGLSLFLGGGFLYLVPRYLPQAPWAADSAIADAGYVLALAGMLVLIVYKGFVYATSKAIPFWNSPLHPAMYIAFALRGGIAALLITLALGGETAATRDLLLLWTAVTAVVTVFFALEMHAALTGGNPAARRSVHELLSGRVAIAFYGGTLTLGVIVPAWFVWAGLSGPRTLAAMVALGVTSVIGDFFMKYSMIRAGVHLPVWTRQTLQRG
ncbi:MAG: polysulfide reductase NrfD [Burkholderiales bacterium]|nr:polysulfide reductase NrfD [Burkholderiales bacterium]